MTSKNSYSEANLTSRKEFAEFVATLTDQQLSTRMPADWTVSSVLVHLAFWDYRALTLIKKWQNEGLCASPNDVDVVNEATRPFLNAIEPCLAVALMLDTARQIDEAIDSLEPSFIKTIEEEGKTVHLDRSKHRYGHLAEIKAILGKN